MSGVLNRTPVLELGLLSGKVPPRVLRITMVEFTVLDSAQLSSVLLRENLAVLHWLNSAVVVILVNLLVDGRVNILMLVSFDNLDDVRTSVWNEDPPKWYG